MFDFAWSEIALVGIVALIAIGPKDLPVAIKTVSELVKKARKMAGEFQTHVDEMVREANLHEVKDTFNDLRRMDIKGKILNAVDGDGSLRKTIADKPFDLHPAPPPVPVADAVPGAVPGAVQDAGAMETATVVADRPEHAMAGPLPERPAGPPAFLPPAVVAAGSGPPAPPPAFVPPAAVALAQTPARVPAY